MKLVFIYGDRISSRLTKLFTGSTCYHVGFSDGAKFWDMHKIRRRRNWEGLYAPERVLLVETPVPMTAAYLDHKLDTDEAEYSTIDYLRFGFRWLYHLFGQSTPNAGGIICSEMATDDMISNGWVPPADADCIVRKEVAAPADLELMLLGRKDALYT